MLFACRFRSTSCARERLRQMAGQGQASVAWMLGRVVEAGLLEKKRLLAGIQRRLELALAGGLVESERAGGVQVPLSPKAGLQLAELATALDHTAGGVAGLIVKVVLDDNAWTMAIFTDAVTEKGKPQ